MTSIEALVAGVQHRSEPASLAAPSSSAPNQGLAYSDLAIDFIDGDRVTLMARGSLSGSDAVAHRLRTLIAAGVHHISIDVRQVREIEPPTLACLIVIASCLSDTGGTLELINVNPVVAAAFAAGSNGEGARHVRP